jgi:pyridoxal phosphate enzyme (YggS family)
VDSLSHRYHALLTEMDRQLLSSGRPARDAGLLAVSKTHSVDRIEELYREGHRDFGENYAQELEEKAKELHRRNCHEIRWHFIGHLQTNKVKRVAPWLFAIHSLDSLKLAQELVKRRKDTSNLTPLRVFLEVNIGAEASKSGLRPQEALLLAEQLAGTPGLAPPLQWEGLMCIPAPGSADEARASFRSLRQLASQLPPSWNRHLSMGMSGDFAEALQEGSHWVRVGTALFGARPSRSPL